MEFSIIGLKRMKFSPWIAKLIVKKDKMMDGYFQSVSQEDPPKVKIFLNAFLHHSEPIQKKAIQWWNGHDPPPWWKFPSCFYFFFLTLP